MDERGCIFHRRGGEPFRVRPSQIKEIRRTLAIHPHDQRAVVRLKSGETVDLSETYDTVIERVAAAVGTDKPKAA